MPPPLTDPLATLRARSAHDVARRRILLTLQAVTRMQREVALHTLQEKLDEFVAHVPDPQLGDPLSLCSAVSEAWQLLSPAQQNRLRRFVRSMPAEQLPDAMSAAWATLELRPDAESRLSAMSEDAWRALSRAAEVPPEWVAIAVRTLQGATTWNEANPVRTFLVPHAGRVDEQQVRALIEAAARNQELRTSWAIKDVLSALSTAPSMGAAKLIAHVEAMGAGDLFRDHAWWPEPARSQTEA
jgi:hypothetical protein